MFLIAATELSRFIKYVTPFTDTGFCNWHWHMHDHFCLPLLGLSSSHNTLHRFSTICVQPQENIFATFIGTARLSSGFAHHRKHGDSETSRPCQAACSQVYINDGIQGMIRVWNSGTADVAARKLLVFNMTLGCTALAYYLSKIPSTASWMSKP